MKSILVHIGNDNKLKSRLIAACDMARATGGHITCIHSNPYAASFIYNGMTGPSVIFDFQDALKEENKKLRIAVEAHLSKEDISWTYITENNQVIDGLVKHSKLADIIVMSSSGQENYDPGHLGLLGDILHKTNAPILVVPDQQKNFNITGTAIVAWNGSFEAGNSLKMATPLLKYANNVKVITLEEKSNHDLPPLLACEYLSRHDIHAEVETKDINNNKVVNGLIDAAKQYDASYMVIGGYSHSRAQEFLFGGVTRTLLKNSPIPIFVAR